MIRATAVAVLLRIAGTGLWLAYSVLLARLLSQEDFGLVFYAVNFVLLAGPIASLGFEGTTLRFGARYWPAGERGHFAALVAQARLRALVGATLCAIGIAIAVLLRLDNPLVADPAIAALTAAAVALFALMGIHRDALRAAGRLVYGLLDTTVTRAVVPLAISAALALAGVLDTTTALAAFVGGLGLSVILELRWMALFGLTNEPPERDRLAEQARVARHLWVGDAGAILLTRADALVVGMVLDLRAVALYLAAQRIAVLATFLLDAVRLAIAPELSRGFRAGAQSVEFRRLLARAAALFFATGTLGSLGALAIGWPALALFGQDYIPAFPALAILVAGQFSWAFFGPTALVMTMTDMERERSVVGIVMAALMVAMTWLGARYFGIEGAALGATVAVWICNGGMSLLVARRHGNLTGIFNSAAMAFLRPRAILAAIAGLTGRGRRPAAPPARK